MGIPSRVIGNDGVGDDRKDGHVHVGLVARIKRMQMPSPSVSAKQLPRNQPSQRIRRTIVEGGVRVIVARGVVLTAGAAGYSQEPSSSVASA